MTSDLLPLRLGRCFFLDPNGPYSLDKVLNGIPEYSQIILRPGVYTVRGYAGQPGDSVLKRGTVLQGAGKNLTIIKRDPSIYSDRAHVLYSEADEVEVRDLTLDASAGEDEKLEKFGILLAGADCALERVKCINTSGNYAEWRECQSVFVGDPSFPERGWSTVRDCEVSQVRGTYCNGIQIGGRGLIENCRVSLPRVDGAQPVHYHAFGLVGSAGSICRGCFSEGGTHGFYNDYGDERLLTVEGCYFRNCQSGIVLRLSQDSTIDGARFIRNVIELNPLSGSAYSMGIVADNLGHMINRDIVLDGNRVGYATLPNDSPVPPPSDPYALSLWAPLAQRNLVVQVTNNTFMRGWKTLFYAQNAQVSGNRDFEGQPFAIEAPTP